ncbi:amidase [Bacillaceae bacterium W0354]
MERVVEMNITELKQLDGLGQKELLDKKEITPLELTEHYIEQIQKFNPTLNAVVHTMFDEAINQVKNNQYGDGPLAGMPFLIKDLNAIKGHPNTNGSKLLKDVVAPESDLLVQRYEKAGLVFLGKTNTPEFGFLPTTEPELFGPTKNPWDLERSPGGSSGGAAAAVAAGLIPFAHASDGGGSIRIPATACGLFGLKPSRGMMPYAPYVDHLSINHAVTRSVRDSAALLDVLKGGAPTDNYPTADRGVSFLQAIKEEPRKLKIAYTADFNGKVNIDEETRKAFEHAVDVVKALGHEVVEASPEFNYELMAESFIKVWMATGAVVIKHMGMMVGQEPSTSNLEKLSLSVLEEGKKLTAEEYEEARVFMQMEGQKLLAFHSDYDLLLTPVLSKEPIKTGSLVTEKAYSFLNTFTNYVSFTPIANATGQPAMSVPLYWTENNVPIGAHFTGRIGDDALLFQLAAQLEKEHPWMSQYQKIQL